MTARTMTHDDARRIAERYYALLNTHDPDVADQVYTADVRLDDDGAADPVIGLEAARNFLDNMFTGMPGIHLELIRDPHLSPDGRSMALLVRATSDRKSRRPSTGATVSWEFSSWYEVDVETERMRYGRVIVNFWDMVEQVVPWPRRKGWLMRTLEGSAAKGSGRSVLGCRR